MTRTTLRPYHQPQAAQKIDLWSLAGMPKRGRGLHDLINSGLPFSVLETLADITGIEQQALGAYLLISRTTFRRRKAAGRFTASESDRIFRLVKVMDAAIELFEGNEVSARNWLNGAAPGLSGRRPIDMIGSMAETESVLDLIARLEQGATV